MKKPLFWPKVTLIPFWKELVSYKPKYFKKDIVAALSVALIAIPQSIAYSLLAGLPLSAGLYAAIFGTIFTGFFGASRYLVAGPTTGVAILIQVGIADTLATFYPQVIGAARDELTIHILMQLVIFMGVFQIIAGLVRIGRALRFVSRSVILGYFTGVMLTIIINQLYYFTGIAFDEGYHVAFVKAGYFISHLSAIHFWEIFIGVISVAILFFLRKYKPRWPSALIMLVIVSVLFYVVCYVIGPALGQQEILVASLKNMGYNSFPKIYFAWPGIDIDILEKIWPYALTISSIAILEIFSISRTIVGKTGERESSSQGIFALGISNSFLSFIVGAMPASGSVSRSFVNLEQHAKTRFSMVFSGLLVAIFILFFWPFVQHVPIAALAALILMMVPRVLDFSQIRLCFKATRSDAVVFLMTVGSCLLFSLDIAFFLGIIFSIVFFLKRAAEPHLVEFAFDASAKLISLAPTKRKKRKIRILGIGGDLFFGVVDIFQKAVQKIAADPYVEVIVLRLNGVYHMDASMCMAIDNFYKYLQETNRHLVICGISQEVWRVLGKSGLFSIIGKENFFLSNETKPQLSTWQAFLRAETLIESLSRS